MAAVETKVFNDESQIDSIYVAHLRSTSSKPRCKPECPNHSDELTYEGFVDSADALIEPFSKVVEEYYAN